MLKWLTVALIFLFSDGFSQFEYHYLVQFKYKAWGDLTSPESYLSDKTISKRSIYEISIDSSDIPLNPFYIDSLSKLPLSIEAKSKWHNCLVIASPLASLKDSISEISFIDTTYLIGERSLSKTVGSSFDYEESYEFIEPLGLNQAHEFGFTGEGVEVAVIDAGFKNLNYAEPYEHLFTDGKISSSYDFVNNRAIDYNGHPHGANVTSFIAAKKDSFFVGTAPNSSLHLLITEDVNQENLIEEFHMIEAIEYCDSAGVDIVNISLGYNEFDDTRFSHVPSDFDGTQTKLNKACNIGWEKGLFIVASAGNEGTSSWGVTTTPGNADSVFTVGSINSSLDYSNFSSRGNPYYLKSQKPSLVAIGEGINALNSSGSISRIEGTSYSCPQIAGFAACLMEAFPGKKNWEIRRAIEESAHNHSSPDSLIGYGIPSFNFAFEILTSSNEIPANNDLVFPNPNIGDFKFLNSNGKVKVEIFDLRGSVVFVKESNEKVITFSNLNLNKGVYFLISSSDKKKTISKFAVR